MRKLLVILGVPVDALNMRETLDRIEQMVQAGRATGKAHQVATVNVDFLVQSLFDPELRYLLQRADLLTADGMPLVWGARRLGTPLEGRVAGADLVPALARRCAERGFSIYFLGGKPGVAARAAAILSEQNPGLRIAGIHSPPFSPVLSMDTSFLEAIRAARPDVLLVAFGNPKQEKWIGMYGRRIGAPVMMGVGGSLDFVAGETRRAPEWMQRMGFEWLFRLLQEPRRLFRRYVIDLAIFSSSYLRQWWWMHPRAGSTGEHNQVELARGQGYALLKLRGSFDAGSLEIFFAAAEQAVEASPHVLADLAGVDFLDSSAAGALVDLGNRAQNRGGELSLAAVPGHIHRLLKLLKLEDLFPTYADVEDFLSAQAAPKAAAPIVPVSLAPGSGGRNWVILEGCRILDASTAPVFLEAGASALAANPFLVCDLSKTVFLASAGLAALAHLRQMAAERQGELRVVNCSPDVLRVIQLARFDRVLSLFSDTSVAIA